MSNAVKVKVEGLSELEDVLLNKAPRDVRKAVRAALKPAGTWMAGLMAAVAPRRSGFLATHIVSKISISTKQDNATVSVGPSKDAYYAQFDEFGSAHNKPPQPFMRRTFETNSQGWLDMVVTNLKSVLGWGE